jgi:hypothetical protein
MTAAFLVVCVAAWAVYGSVRRNRERVPRSQADLLDVLSGIVEKARETPPGALDQEDVPTVPGVVLVPGRPEVAAAPAAAARPKRVARRSRSMNPAAVAARRDRANRRMADGLRAGSLRDGSLIVIRSHEEDPVITEVAPDRGALSIEPGRARRRRLPRPSRRVLVPMVVTVAAAALAFLGVVAYNQVPGSGRSTVTANASAARAVPLTPARPAPPRSQAARGTTTAGIQPLATSGSGAIVATHPSYHLGITAAALCWVRVTDATSGLAVMEGVLKPGEHRDLTLAGPALVRLGNRMAAVLTVDTVPVVLDRSVPSPFDVAFTGKA